MNIKIAFMTHLRPLRSLLLSDSDLCRPQSLTRQFTSPIAAREVIYGARSIGASASGPIPLIQPSPDQATVATAPYRKSQKIQIANNKKGHNDYSRRLNKTLLEITSLRGSSIPCEMQQTRFSSRETRCAFSQSHNLY